MKYRLLLPALAILIASCSSNAGKEADTPWFPLAVGNTWTYSCQMPMGNQGGGAQGGGQPGGQGGGQPGGAPAGPQKSMIVKRVTGYDTISRVKCAKIEVTQDGKTVGTEYMAALKDGIYRYEIDDKEPSSPVRILKLPPDKDAAWTISARGEHGSFSCEMKISEESVTGPAGKFDAVVAAGDLKLKSHAYSISNAFAKNVGIVRIKTSPPGDNLSLDLEKYLVLLSNPPEGFSPGSTFKYTVEAQGSSRLLNYSLRNGPPGMEQQGNVFTWNVPNDFQPGQVEVEITISDNDQQLLHKFTLTKGR
jgi:hypothetical protein